MTSPTFFRDTTKFRLILIFLFPILFFGPSQIVAEDEFISQPLHFLVQFRAFCAKSGSKQGISSKWQHPLTSVKVMLHLMDGPGLNYMVVRLYTRILFLKEKCFPELFTCGYLRQRIKYSVARPINTSS